MAVFLVVKVTDLSAPQGSTIVFNPLAIPATLVKAAFDGGPPAPMQAVTTGTDQTGVFELQIPAGVTKIEVAIGDSGQQVTVGNDKFWAVSQKLILDSTKPPTLKFDGSQEVNITRVANHTRGTDFAVEVHVVMGQLRDAPNYTNVSGLDFSFRPVLVPSYKTPILNPAGKGINQINFTLVPNVTPLGVPLFIAERTSMPQIVAIYRPIHFAEEKYKIDQSVPYHLFLHPNIPWPDPYPNGFNYPEMVQRYSLDRVVPIAPGRKEKVDNGKHIIHQHVLAGEKMVFVFPISKRNESMGTLDTQSATLRFLQEVNYWLQRMDLVSLPAAPIKQVALSGFSAGITFVSKIIMGPKNPLFFDQLLKEVYCLDGIFEELVLGKDGKPVLKKDGKPKEQESQKRTAEFCTELKAWFRGGADGRAVRVYTQRDYWFENFKDAIPSSTVTNGPNKSKEIEGASGTVVLLPLALWKSADKTITTSIAHQEFPGRFLQHAIERSSLPVAPPSKPPTPPGGTPSITTPSKLTSGVENKPYPNTTLQVSGGIAPFIWKVKNGELPPGLSLSPSGEITGTSNTPPKPFHFDVVVEDSLGNTSLKGFDLEVLSDNCFIIGAAHGSQLAPQVKFLWDLRQNVLNQMDWGRKFFSTYWPYYYRISPAIAEEMGRDPEMKKTVRWSIVEPWTNYMKLLLIRPDWDRIDFAKLDPSLRDFLLQLRTDMEDWIAQIELPSGFSQLEPLEAVRELNVILKYIKRTGGLKFLDGLAATGDLPLSYDKLHTAALVQALHDGGRTQDEIDRILGPGAAKPN